MNYLTTEQELLHSSRIYILIPTLRQAWSRKRSETAICVQDIDDQCVLQITLVHAVCCALHRLASQVIHRIGLYLCFIIVSKLINTKHLHIQHYLNAILK
jgi:hypothetical protein